MSFVPGCLVFYSKGNTILIRTGVYDAEDVQTADGTGFFGGSTLGTVEVGRDGNNGVGDGATKVRLGDRLHLIQDHGEYFLRRPKLRAKLESRTSLVEK